MFAKTPLPPYFAVIFTSKRTSLQDGYACMSNRMVELAGNQPGFLGVESVNDENGGGITVSYWASEGDIRHWKHHVEHTLAREQGRTRWYSHYETRIAKVERAYGFYAKTT